MVCAGTSDVPVNEEAAITAEVLGNHVKRLYDCGVAGIHRLLNSCEVFFEANVAVETNGYVAENADISIPNLLRICIGETAEEIKGLKANVWPLWKPALMT
jgi:hypothetical protein